MTELSTPTLCLIGTIAVTLAVPKYVQLPESLDLLFHDRMGQILLLGLAAVIGSYNFAVGLMLAVFFMSLMLSSPTVQEGFESENDDEPEEEDDENQNLGEEDNLAVMNTDENIAFEEGGDDYEGEEFTDPSSSKGEQFKTKKTKKNKNSTSCKFLINQMNRIQKHLKKKRCDEAEVRSDEAEVRSDEPRENENFEESEDGDLEEGFGCGCGGNGDYRKKKANMLKAGAIEPFQNPEPQPNDSTNYDIAGCRYDLQSGPHTESINGAPLSSCEAYKSVDVGNTGTVFYPLN